MSRYRVYLAGPITLGDYYHNLGQAVRKHTELMELGFTVHNPMLTMCMPDNGKFNWDTWLDWCLPWVEQADIVYRLPGASKGADLEVAHARKHGVTVVLTTEALLETITRHELEAHRKGII